MELIQGYEKCSLTAYKATPEEKWSTIGWGHYGPESATLGNITQEVADALFLTDVALKAVVPIRREIIFLDLPQGVLDALTSLVFNVGPGPLFPTSAVGKPLREGDLREVAAGFRRYVFQGRVRLRGLERRREAEISLFLS